MRAARQGRLHSSRTPTSPGATSKAELEEYLTELATRPVRDYFRPNFLAEHAGHPPPSTCSAAVAPRSSMRLVLAATLSPSYGIYSGYELCENAPREPAARSTSTRRSTSSKPRDLERPGNIRAVHRAAQRDPHASTPRSQHYDNLTFHRAANEQRARLRASEPTARRPDARRVNLDPQRRSTEAAARDPAGARVSADDDLSGARLLTGARYPWQGGSHYVRLRPATRR